jgi:hypothetical protein
MQTQADNLRNIFTGLAFTNPQQHARMAQDIGVEPMRGVSGGYGSDTPMSDSGKTFTDAGAQIQKGVHATAGSQTDRKKRPTLTESKVHTTGYEPSFANTSSVCLRGSAVCTSQISSTMPTTRR